MTINQLTYLVSVVEAGINLSRASRHLGISQPNISKQIALLENEFGSALFERAGRRLHALTPTGRQLYRHAVKMTEELARLHENVAPAVVERTVVIGTTAATIRYVLPGMLAAAAPGKHGIAIEVQHLSGDEICQAVLDGRCDVGLVSGAVKPDKNLLFLPWYRWRYRLIYARGSHRPSRKSHNGYAAIREHQFAACASVTAPRAAVLRAMEELGISPQIGLISPDPDEVKQAVRSRQYVGLIAEMAYCEQADGDLEARESPSPLPTLLAWIAIRRSSLLRESVSTVVQGIAPHLAPGIVERLRRTGTADDPASLARSIRVPRYG